MNAISLQMQTIASECVSEHEYITDSLERLRHELEQGTVLQAWAEIELPVGLMLADVCDALGLSMDQQRQVMGDAGMVFVEITQNTKVSV